MQAVGKEVAKLQGEEEVLSLEWLQSFTARVINQDLYPQYNLWSSANFHASSTLEDSRETIYSWYCTSFTFDYQVCGRLSVLELPTHPKSFRDAESD